MRQLSVSPTRGLCRSVSEFPAKHKQKNWPSFANEWHFHCTNVVFPVAGSTFARGRTIHTHVRQKQARWTDKLSSLDTECFLLAQPLSLLVSGVSANSLSFWKRRTSVNATQESHPVTLLALRSHLSKQTFVALFPKQNKRKKLLRPCHRGSTSLHFNEKHYFQWIFEFSSMRDFILQLCCAGRPAASTRTNKTTTFIFTERWRDWRCKSNLR